MSDASCMGCNHAYECRLDLPRREIKVCLECAQRLLEQLPVEIELRKRIKERETT